MRYAVLSDVHANLHALEATLRHLAAERVDHYICAGDFVGYGPHPNECVRLLSSLRSTAVAGNHDLMVLGRLEEHDATPLARDSVRWTRARLDQRSRAFLSALPTSASIDGVVITHGSMQQIDAYIRTLGEAEEQLRSLARVHPGARVLILGHTHEAAAFGQTDAGSSRIFTRSFRLDADRYLLNPGSVGQSRDGKPRARFAVLDLSSSSVRLHSIPYDVRGCREALRRAGLPESSCLYTPPLFERARAALERAWGRVVT